MMHQLKPPFEIYLNGMQIADAEGHICSAESPEIAQALLALLNTNAQSVPTSAEEKELFAAVTKHDLAGAVSHLRDFFSVPQDYHRKQYADLLEAQAKLIAWLIDQRAHPPKVDLSRVEGCKLGDYCRCVSEPKLCPNWHSQEVT